MKQQHINTHVIRLYVGQNDDGASIFQEFTIAVNIDTLALARQLARKAITNKSRKSHLAKGAITIHCLDKCQ